MEPIVSPWFIYLLLLVNNVICLCVLATILAFVALLIYYIGWGMATDYGDDRESWVAGWGKKVKMSWIIMIVGFILATFIPTKDTIIAMYVADNITPNNVEKALEVGKDFKDEIKKDIFELIEAIQKGESESGD